MGRENSNSHFGFRERIRVVAAAIPTGNNVAAGTAAATNQKSADLKMRIAAKRGFAGTGIVCYNACRPESQDTS